MIKRKQNLLNSIRNIIKVILQVSVFETCPFIATKLADENNMMEIKYLLQD